MWVIATAGHVDHGKSTVVRALTSMEPDRWAEERRRGLTIDLGFAWATLDDGQQLAFVDVPGHARFVPNMLAGVGEVPAVLFVVAADEGWMPQSEEHLAALDAFGVRHGLLVVTRSDLADPAPVLADAGQRLAATSLGDVPAVAVSAVTGAGLTELRAGLAGLVAALPTPDLAADVRLWVDRSFTVRGAGTVVTATLRGGTVTATDELVLASTGTRMRVRGLQSLGRSVDRAQAVARLAVNLRGVDTASIQRGDALLTPDAWHRTAEIDVALSEPELAELPAELVLHLGSAAVPVRPRLLGPGVARLRLARPLPLRFDDHGLLRDPGRHLVVAGLRVLDPAPAPLARRGAARTRAARLDSLRAGSAADAAALTLHERGFVGRTELHRLGLPAAGIALGDWQADPRWWATARAELPTLVRAWRAEHPLQPGIPVDVAGRRLGLPRGLVERAAAAAELLVVDGQVRPPNAGTELPERLRAALDELAADFAEAPFVAPDSDRLRALGVDVRGLAAAVRAGRLLKLADGVVLPSGADTRAVELLSTLDAPFTVSAAKNALGTTRRVAVPLLELLDRNGVTERLPDNTRRLRARRSSVEHAETAPETRQGHD